jgi:hypothetical protein
MCDIHNLIDFINSLSTFVVAIFTIVMCVLVGRQNHATRLMERPWIVVDMEKPVPYESNKKIRYVATIMNQGHTPAWITAMGSHGQIVKTIEDLPKQPQYDMAGPFSKKGSPMPPGAVVHQPFWLEETRLSQVERGESTLFLFGMVKYRDVFGVEHETRYCYQFKPALGLTDPVMRDFYVGGPDTYIEAT